MGKSVEYWLEKLWGISHKNLDEATAESIAVDSAHHKVHEGNHFFVSRYAALDETDTVSFAITTPDTAVWLHVLWTMSASKSFTIQFYEGASVSDGTIISPINSNRNIYNLSDAAVVMDPTINSTGVLLGEVSYGSLGTPKFAPTGGSESRESEIVLRQDTTYLWVITSNEDTSVVTFTSGWYEHVNEE